MANQSKLSLMHRTRSPRMVAVTRRAWDDETVTYLVSVVIAVAAMLAATLAGFVR